MKPPENSPDNIGHTPGFLQKIHKKSRGDEDQDDIQVGEGAFDDVPGRDSETTG